jgi:hypothetical protein
VRLPGVPRLGRRCGRRPFTRRVAPALSPPVSAAWAIRASRAPR